MTDHKEREGAHEHFQLGRRAKSNQYRRSSGKFVCAKISKNIRYLLVACQVFLELVTDRVSRLHP